AIPTDEAALSRGKHLVEVIGGCPECHAYSLQGDPNFMNEPLIGHIPAANLTPHQTGVGSLYTVPDWERAIRHGVGHDGRALIGVSSGALQHLSDADVATIIAYLQSVPPGSREIPPRRLGLLARPFILLAFIMPEEENDIMPALVIDHTTPRPPAPEPGITVAYGRYLVLLTCVECHKADLGGGRQPGEGMNITTGGNLGNWTEAEFIWAIKTGRTPEGNSLNVTYMPQNRLRHLTEEELEAIWLYIQSMPPVVRKQ
ncbi:MAG TPA: cytochrome c, partial [Chloroflexota bacterium]|nr:cytochrome c [Chloroflexota bacterium]